MCGYLITSRLFALKCKRKKVLVSMPVALAAIRAY